LTEDDLDWLGGLPLQQRVSLGGASFRLVHACPLDPELVQDLQTILERGGP
jgi:hypothetical protein